MAKKSKGSKGKRGSKGKGKGKKGSKGKKTVSLDLDKENVPIDVVKHPSELPPDSLSIAQLQQYLGEVSPPVDFSGHEYDRPKLLQLLHSSAVTSVRRIDETDNRWLRLTKRPIYLKETYAQSRLSLHCPDLTADGPARRGPCCHSALPFIMPIGIFLL
jgi:hypothetical protein